jgi:hypothetical protein
MDREAGKIPNPETSLRRESAQKRFVHDLPQFLNDHLGSWVAYHGDKQLGIARHSGELYDACRQRRLPLEELVLFEIVSPDQEIPLGPMAFD